MFFVIIITVQIWKSNITVSTQFLLLYYHLWCPGLQRIQHFDLTLDLFQSLQHWILEVKDFELSHLGRLASMY